MCPSDFDSFSDGLVEETLVETATTFFGARKALEDEIALYRKRAEDLSEVEAEVLARAAALHYLLLEGELAEEFYAALGVHPGHLLDMVDLDERDMSGLPVPFALTLSGRYGKLLQATYTALASSVEAYLHGCYFNDGTGRKCLTVNYGQLEKWCKDLNAKIEAVNENHSPSGTLCFVKGLNPAMIEKDRLSDATLDGYCDELDKELAFQPVECIAMNYLAAPELPGPDKAKPTIARFAKDVCAKAGGEVKRLLAGWEPGE